MAIDKELAQILKEVKLDIRKAIKPVSDKMKEIESETIKDNVYSVYSQSYGDRREDEGGLSDVRNMQASYMEGRDNLVIEVINTTTGNIDYLGSNKSDYIQDVIESGSGYWNTAIDERVGARPFIDDTQAKIDSSIEIERIVENELRKLGWDL